MTTTSPSWFLSWPSTFADIESAYLRTVPRQWPGGLYRDGTDERRDLDSAAVVLSWVAQGGEWINRRIFPQFDDDGQFFHIWEEAFAIQAAATVALRQAAIIAYARLNLGTATKEVIQRIMAPIFGVDYTDIEFSFGSYADIAGGGYTGNNKAFLLCHFHIHTDGAAAPDRPRALDAIARFKPTWIRITVGQYKTLKWDTEGEWDTACWGA